MSWVLAAGIVLVVVGATFAFICSLEDGADRNLPYERQARTGREIIGWEDRNGVRHLPGWRGGILHPVFREGDGQ